MNLVVTLLSLLAIGMLTAGTALFVAAEFSLTTLERSTVEANKCGSRRTPSGRDPDSPDRLYRRAASISAALGKIK